MTGLRGHENDFHGGAVAHFANEDNLWRLTQRRTQAIRIVVKILPKLALIDRGLEFWVKVLNRVLQRDHVDRLRVVNLVEHRGQGGRFTGASAASEENNAIFFFNDFAENRR